MKVRVTVNKVGDCLGAMQFFSLLSWKLLLSGIAFIFFAALDNFKLLMYKGLKWLVFLGLFIYIIARSFMVPITHDEAYSYLLVKTNYIVAMAGTANTHWINSLGMKLGSLLLGDDPWQLRLFSMMAWLLYGFSAIRISEKLKNKLLGFALFTCLVANPFLLDFFSLARG